MPAWSPTRDVRSHFGLETGNERVAVDQPGLSQKHDIPDVPLDATFQFCQRQVVRLERP